jgi:hypothetical protein
VTRGCYCGSGIRAEDGGARAVFGIFSDELVVYYHIIPPRLLCSLSRYHEFLLAFYAALSVFASIISHLSLVFRTSMPTLSLDSLIKGSVYHEDKKDRETSSRPSYSSRDRYASSNGDRKSSHGHSHSHGDDRLVREKQWLQNSNSTKSAVDITTSASPPPAYSEIMQAPLPTPTPRPTSISKSPRTPSVPPVRTLPRLQVPVIIPQNPRDGGFCRAYAPLLEECKVTKTAFFYFLDDFDRSAQASPYFSAVNIASIGSLNRPHSTAMIVTLAKKRYAFPFSQPHIS